MTSLISGAPWNPSKSGVRIAWAYPGYGYQPFDYNDPERLEPNTILRISEQLLDAMAFVHKAG